MYRINEIFIEDNNKEKFDELLKETIIDYYIKTIKEKGANNELYI